MKNSNLIEAKFQDFVKLLAVRVNPKPGHEKVYIGLEHLIPNRLHLTCWGGDIELKGQKYAVKKGNILFAKRNAYLKRVSIAPIDGLFSAHGMVFEPSGKLLINGFLPYILLSQQFWDRAISISEGSLSPTIKWDALAKQKFSLPEPKIQEKYLPILDKLTDQERKLNEMLISINKLLTSTLKNIFPDYFNILKHKRVSLPSGWGHRQIRDVLVGMPVSGDSLNVVDRETEHYVLNLNCLTKDGFHPNGYKTVDPKEFSPSLILNAGDLLISRSNTIELVGLVGIYKDEKNRKAIFPDTMWRLNVNEDIVDKEFLMNYLLSPHARREIQRIAAGSSGSMKKINKSEFGKMPVPVPPMDIQIKYNQVLSGFRKTQKILINKLEVICELRLSLINRLLEDKL